MLYTTRAKVRNPLEMDLFFPEPTGSCTGKSSVLTTARAWQQRGSSVAEESSFGRTGDGQDGIASTHRTFISHVAHEHGRDETNAEDAVSGHGRDSTYWAAARRLLCVPLRSVQDAPLLVAPLRRTVKSMGELNVEGRQNAWKETGNGKPATDVTNPSLAAARPILGKTRLGAVTEASSMVQAPSAEFLQKNVWHRNVNEGILSTIQPGARMDFRRRKSDVTRC